MNKEFYSVLLTVLLSILLSACGSGGSQTIYRLDYIPYENEDNDDDEYGLLGKDSNTFPKRFEEKTTPVVNGYFAMEEDDAYTICRVNEDSYDKLPNATGYAKVGVMNDGLIPVCKENEHIQVLDQDGIVKYSLETVDGVDIWECYSYSCGKMRIQLNNEQFVFVDENGHNIFKKTYEWATDFDNGYAVVGIGDDKFQLINADGEELFSFVCDDPDEIVFSTKYQKLSAKDENDIYTVYSFDGKFTYLPKMVEGVYALLENEFIFKNDSYYGLMSYDDCKDKIYAKYDQLVPNGKYYLGIHTDNDEIVQLLDSNGNELAKFDGEEILSPVLYGYDYPNIIKRPDDRIFLVDDKGDMIGRAENFDFDMDDIQDASRVHNLYFPSEQIENKILSLCGDGKGIPDGEGAFFSRDGSHCHPYEISYFKNSTDVEKFQGKYSDQHLIERGVNYYITLSFEFDEPIVRSYEEALNRTAWLKEIEVEVTTTSLFYGAATYNGIESALINKGCYEIFSNKKGSILRSSDSKNLLFLQHGKVSKFTITMMVNNDTNIATLKSRLEGTESQLAK